MIRFVRVTYVRPQDEAIECVTMYSPPPGKLNNSSDIDVPVVIIKRHENTVELSNFIMLCRFESFMYVTGCTYGICMYMYCLQISVIRRLYLLL